MTRSLLRIAFATVLLSACSSPPPRPTFADIHFTSEPPIELDVARIEVRVAYQPPYQPPHVEHLFPIPPEHALENWAHDRLKAVGSSGEAVFTITDASVIETDLKTQGGLSGAFTTQPAERYDMTLAANLVVGDASGLNQRTASVKTMRSQSLLQGITPNDRDKAWYDMTVKAMDDFDHQMASEIRNNFGTFAR
jgi:hypothetical protein